MRGLKGDHHARPLHRLDDNGRHCRDRCRHHRFGVHHGDMAQAPAASVTAPVPALKTSWGEPDLQGIWTDEFDTPLQRPAKYAEQEFFTEAQRAGLDKERTEMLNRRAVGTLADAYIFLFSQSFSNKLFSGAFGVPAIAVGRQSKSSLLRRAVPIWCVITGTRLLAPVTDRCAPAFH